jgi:O-antigen/teichoic acid export membrane protein
MRNIVTGIGGQLLNNLLKFICRTVFIYTLGKEYLGISSLYINILSVLSISELGFSSAITYSLYKPLAENDIPKVQALMNFFRRAYKIIGLIILGVGLLLMPFLPNLMKGVSEKINIYLFYVLYLIQTSVSYFFFAYKATLLIADQKKYISDFVIYSTQVIMIIIQIIILLFTRSFLFYTIIMIVGNIVQNLAIAKVADKKYKYLKKNNVCLDNADRKDVYKRVYAMSLYKVSTTIVNSTDNLIISSFISVLAVGIYDNYYLIVNAVRSMVVVVFQAFTASLGNLFVTESKERNEFIFRCVNFLNFWVVGFCSICFLVLFQPFITLWIGSEYVFDYYIVVIIVANYATCYLQNAVLVYKDASGLFVKGKYRAVVSAVLNFVLSIILVQYWGIAGVFMGTIISRLLTTWWYDAWLLYKHGFGMSPVKYYARYIRSCAIIAIVTLLINFVSMPLSGVKWENLIVKLIICVFLVNMVFYLLFGRSEEFIYIVDKGKNIINKKTKNKFVKKEV